MQQDAPDRGPMAVVGMACRLPGANTPSELFSLLRDRADVRTPIRRFNAAGYYGRHGATAKGLSNVQHGYFVKDDVTRFDNDFFAISPNEARAMDPQQRLLLEVTYEAAENAGITLAALRGSNTSVYTGLFTSDYTTSLLRDVDSTPAYMSTGASNSISASRISYFFDLHGPSLVLDTACSSSAVALHHALSGLQRGEADMAIVCGANLILNPDMFIHMSEMGFLSPDGRCKSFDASADGYARGEGVAALIIKPLSTALRHGNPVRAILRGSRINHDGRTPGITQPSRDSQASNMRALYKQISVDPDDIQYFEAHATGTFIGDPIELAAIRSVFFDSEQPREQSLLLGSVKSSIGHLEACAALASIIKTVECMERGVITPQLHYQRPNKSLDLSGITIPTGSVNWPKKAGVPQIAAVNSFGFGGANAHIVLQGPDSPPLKADSTDLDSVVTQERPHLFKISAASDASLQQAIANLKDYITRRKPHLPSLAHTLLAHRSTLFKSVWTVASSHKDLLAKLNPDSIEVRDVQALLEPRNIGFIFTGQGAQWSGMGQDLLQNSAIFSQTIDRCDEILRKLPEPPEWSIREQLCECSRTNDAVFSQPLCTALQLGLVDILKAWGLTPSFAVGHSSGEIAAAYAAGILSLEDAIRVAFLRGRFAYLANAAGSRGAMCAIGLREEQCREILQRHDGHVSLAAVNSPSSCTLSGDEESIDSIVEQSKQSAVFCRKLRVDTAYHSHHMNACADSYAKAMNDTCFQQSSSAQSADLFSTVTRCKLSASDMAPEYWVRNMTCPVQFAPALADAIGHHPQSVAVLEIGPHGALAGPVADILGSLKRSEISHTASCQRNSPGFTAVLQSMAALDALGVRMNHKAINSHSDASKVLVDLPKYPWDHRSSFWAETRVARNHRFRQFPRHELLGARVSFDNPLHMMWRNLLDVRAVPWLQTLLTSHDYGCKVPKSLYLLMILEAARQTQTQSKADTEAITLRHVTFDQDPSFDFEGPPMETIVVLEQSASDADFSFSITAQQAEASDTEGIKWHNVCKGQMSFKGSNAPSLANNILAIDTEEGSDEYRDEQYKSWLVEQKGLKLHSSVANFGANADRIWGDFHDAALQSNDSYIASPELLPWLESVELVLAQIWGMRGSYGCVAIDKIALSPQSRDGDQTTFQLSKVQSDLAESRFNIQIATAAHALDIGGLCMRFQQDYNQADLDPPHFFRPTLMPDISHITPRNRWPLRVLLDMLTHKWPMCDIALCDESDPILSIVKGILSKQRPGIRMIQTSKTWQSLSTYSNVLDAAQVPSTSKFHLICGSLEQVSDLTHRVHADAICLVRASGISDTQPSLGEGFEFMGLVEESANADNIDDTTGWALFQTTRIASTGQPRPLLLLGACDTLASHFSHVISTDPNSSSKLTETKDIVLVDSGCQSFLTQKPGEQILSMLQPHVEHARNLLLIGPSEDPFFGASSALVRTLRSEYPSLNACSLRAPKPSLRDAVLAPVVKRLLEAMNSGWRETEAVFSNGQILITRHRSEDGLACATGLSLAREFDGPPSGGRHCIHLAGPRNPRIIYQKTPPPLAPTEDFLDVAVKASLISFVGNHGHFFVGHVDCASRRESDLHIGDLVIGYHQGPYSSHIRAQRKFLRGIPADDHTYERLCSVGAAVFASHIMKRCIRPLDDEMIQLDLPGPLRLAVMSEMDKLQMFESNDPGQADFVLVYEPSSGFLLNGRSIAVLPTARYVCEQLTSAVSSTFPSVAGSFQTFTLGQIQQAFDHASNVPMSSVLCHESVLTIPHHLIKSVAEEPLFSEHGYYVVIGGLGGLGKTLCKWMVSRGACNIILVGRRSVKEPSSQEFASQLRNAGASVHLIQADACDQHSLGKAFVSIRRLGPILGCFNLAMVLSDAPFAKVSSSDWDQVVRAKVASSWNLHEVTTNDPLNFFIMISSISSLVGNRAQANYAVGNAFQNSLASFRVEQGLPAVALALGAVGDVGVLSDPSGSGKVIATSLDRSGLKILSEREFLLSVQGAIIASQRSDMPVIGTGLKPLVMLNNQLQGQQQAFWANLPDFGPVIDHQFNFSEKDAKMDLVQEISALSGKEKHAIILQKFLQALRNILGRQSTDLDATRPLASYGLDSLNAVECRFWFSKELQIDVPIFEILASRSINQLIESVISEDKSTLPAPVRHKLDSEMSISSHAQRRIWFLHQYIPDKTFHNLVLRSRIHGMVDLHLFRKAWTTFLQRHHVLISRFVPSPTGLHLQKLDATSESAKFHLEVVDVNDTKYSEKLESTTVAARHYAYDLRQGQVIRGWIIRSKSQSAFILGSHHIAWDRTSVPTIFSETIAIYRSLCSGLDPLTGLDALALQYSDYAMWQEKIMSDGLLDHHLKHWKTSLCGFPESSSLLPFSKISERPFQKNFSMGNVGTIIEPEDVARVKKLCNDKSTTAFTAITAVMFVLQHLLTGDSDMVIGIADGDRGHADFDKLVGFTTNMLPLRLQLDSTQTFGQVLDSLHQVCLQAYEHRIVPFDLLLQHLNIDRETSHSPLFQVTVNYQYQGFFQDCDYGTFQLTDFDHFNSKNQSDLSLDVEELQSGELSCEFSYDQAIYDSQGMKQYAKIFKKLLRDVLTHADDNKIEQYDLILHEDKAFIERNLRPHNLGDGAKAKMMPSDLSQFSARIALEDSRRSINYEELNIVSARLAICLTDLGINPGDSVMIVDQNCLESVIAIYAVLRVGAVYVPVDPNFPGSRISSIAADAKVKAVIVHELGSRLREKIQSCDIPMSKIIVGASLSHQSGIPSVSWNITGQDNCCIMFTSGSTGRPKGVPIGHKQLSLVSRNYHDMVGTSSDERFILTASLVFDASFVTIFGAMLRGATLVVASTEERLSSSALANILVKSKVSSCVFTPTQLRILLQAKNKDKLRTWKSLKTLLIVGEYLPPSLVTELFSLGLPKAKFFHGYGPTETTMGVSFHRIDSKDCQRSFIPLGRPLYPASFYITDWPGREVPLGCAGELRIAGQTVNAGYLMSKEAAAQSVFLDCLPDGTPGSVYRTGDLCKLHFDGSIEFLGRIEGDRQVKIRGMRTELAEIETALAKALDAYPEAGFISEVAVVYHDEEFPTGDGILVAYMVAPSPTLIDQTLSEPLIKLLRKFIRKALPIHMMPRAFLLTPSLPQTASAKTDYTAIADWLVPDIDTASEDLNSVASSNMSPIESDIADIWERILQTGKAYSPDDDFFSIGGHSLALVQVKDALQDRYCLSISLLDLFSAPTLGGMAATIGQRLNTEEDGETPSPSGTGQAKDSTIDWAEEVKLSDTDCPPTNPNRIVSPSKVVAMTGACSMAGAYLIHHLLSSTSTEVFCLAVETLDSASALQVVVENLKHWGLLSSIPEENLSRLKVFRGGLSHPTIGLDASQVMDIADRVHSFYILDSDVSLLKRYSNLRATNVASLRYLISLATANPSLPKQIFYLSTWGVPHLQSWESTTFESSISGEAATREVEMSHMQPGSEDRLGYLQARWVCEMLLGGAARKGVPVKIFRSCMCGSSPSQPIPLADSDVNRRLLVACLRAGLVPDFGSDSGGGMSWISADFLADSMVHLAENDTSHGGDHSSFPDAPEIFHLTSNQHVTYKQLASLLATSFEGAPMQSVEPREWFEALEASRDDDLIMEATVLKEWWDAGWVPFGLNSNATYERLHQAQARLPSAWDRDYLLDCVVGRNCA